MSKKVTVQALVLITGINVDVEALDGSYNDFFEALRDGKIGSFKDLYVKVSRPTPDQVLEFAAAQSDWIPQDWEEELRKEAGRPERKAAFAALKKATEPPPDALKILKQDHELAYHWLRVPWDDRAQLALKLGLVTEEQLTKMKPKELQLTILIAAREKGVLQQLWDKANEFRRKWGEIGINSKVNAKEG